MEVFNLIKVLDNLVIHPINLLLEAISHQYLVSCLRLRLLKLINSINLPLIFVDSHSPVLILGLLDHGIEDGINNFKGE